MSATSTVKTDRGCRQEDKAEKLFAMLKKRKNVFEEDTTFEKVDVIQLSRALDDADAATILRLAENALDAKRAILVRFQYEELKRELARAAAPIMGCLIEGVERTAPGS